MVQHLVCCARNASNTEHASSADLTSIVAACASLPGSLQYLRLVPYRNLDRDITLQLEEEIVGS